MGRSKRHTTLKDKAVTLRLKGQSYREISEKLKVAKSTLNGWLKNIEITQKQKQQLDVQWKLGLEKARIRSQLVKKERKVEAIHQSQVFAQNLLKSMKLDQPTLELFLAGLYLGDGFKVNGRLGLGNANPQIVHLFLTLIRKLYLINESKLSAEIFARADQNPDILVDYWSRLLDIPKSQFNRTQRDSRAKNPTRPNYFGVCAVNYSDVVLQRRILAIGNEMLKYRG